jgi:hypothetical protein
LGRLREALETNYLQECMKLVKIHGAEKRNLAPQMPARLGKLYQFDCSSTR